MMLILIISLAVLSAYLLGSIPTAYIFGKLILKKDIRTLGSGNMGATNTMRVIGTKAGILVLLIDILKGFFAIWIANYIFFSFSVVNSYIWITFAALAAILGHAFTIFLGFRGGKGVATASGVFLALIPLSFIFALITFILIVAATRYVSLGSMIAAFCLWLSESLVVFLIKENSEIPNMIFSFIVFCFIVYKHQSNIHRLLKGEENKLSFNKNK